MKKLIHSFLLLFIIIQFGFAQKTNSSIEYDTIEVYNDHFLAYFKISIDSQIQEEGQAFIYPIQTKKNVSADSIVLHGMVKSFWKEGKYRIGQYDHGQKTEMKYFNEEEIEISYQDFYQNLRSQYDPELGTGRYFYHSKE